MKRVRALDKETGAFVKNIHAGTMSEDTRHDHDYACMDPSCGARFHWVKGHPRKENTEHVPPTFARNPGSKHKAGCNYDYEYKTKHNPALTFYDADTGLFHLRINFALGNSRRDRNFEPGMLSREQQRVARNRTHYRGLPNLDQVVKFVEKEFGSLEEASTENLVLHYQGRDYKWNEIFTASDDYKKSFKAAASAAEQRESDRKYVTVVKPVREIESSKNGKRRFSCAPQYGETGKGRGLMTPVIVCDTLFGAKQIDEAIRDKAVLLVAGNPFIPDSVMNAGRRNSTACYLSVHGYAQIARVNPAYWRKNEGPNGEDLFSWADRKNDPDRGNGPQ